jgi:hypothetical protein
MLVTALTSHLLIAPYVAVAAAGLSIQSVAAARMLPSFSGLTASAAGVRSRTSAETTAMNEATRVGVRDLDLHAVVEPIQGGVFAIWLGSVSARTSPIAAAMPAHRVIDATEIADAACPLRDRPTELIPGCAYPPCMHGRRAGGDEPARWERAALTMA